MYRFDSNRRKLGTSMETVCLPKLRIQAQNLVVVNTFQLLRQVDSVEDEHLRPPIHLVLLVLLISSVLPDSMGTRRKSSPDPNIHYDDASNYHQNGREPSH